MILQEPLLVTLVKLVDGMPLPASPQKRGRGHPKVYTEHLIVKALVIMVIRRLYSAYSLLAFLQQDTLLSQQLRPVTAKSRGTLSDSADLGTPFESLAGQLTRSDRGFGSPFSHLNPTLGPPRPSRSR